MANWPSTVATPNRIIERPMKAQIKNDFESGYVNSVARWTRMRRQFELSWVALSAADKAALITFFDSNQGDTFDWIHPETTVTYTARFAEDEIGFEYMPSYARWRGDIVLEEA